ncbi:hypothetical protein LOK49_LG06G01213 [Camellia lanceoleosa]|uniref:Uncharacterized protein n=1 Tax=Camellia lanceoleosa TaxID=1840588 RepID=A0ACC0HBR4_9ERIC|nr:hypothetical protein LOK49_LG06G01213 [Camellia lanceoleosa]
MIMKSHQLEMLPNSFVDSESHNQKPNSIFHYFADPLRESRVSGKETMVGKQDRSIGVLEVYIHQASDIKNICIYHNQDVYAKIFLTSDPEKTVSTQIINGGGQNPVFNESLRLDVKTIDSSLKCEIWMLSRIRNYLEDQLLGFALVPLCDVVIGNGKLDQEFSLSTTDLFHSQAGFVQLSVTYNGSSPEVLEIPSSLARLDSEVPVSVPCELDKIEFPNPNIVIENERMVSEYFQVTRDNFDSKSTECLGKIDDDKHLSSEDTSNQIAHGTSVGGLGSGEVSKLETPPSCVSVALPNIEPEKKMVQQEIVDMYMKSMHQFTESLAKMKLPLEIGNGRADDLGDTGSDEKVPVITKSNGQGNPRVFYGSRAFF